MILYLCFSFYFDLICYSLLVLLNLTVLVMPPVHSLHVQDLIVLFLAVFVALFACFQRIHERRWSMNVELFLAAKERQFCTLFLCYLVCPFISYLLSLAMIFILIFGTFGEKIAPS